MSPHTVQAFEDELQKIAINLGAARRAAGVAARAARAAKVAPSRGVGFWRGVYENLKGTTKGLANPVKGFKRGWSGSGGWTGKGRLTRHLPIGGKSLTLVGGAMMAPDAFSNEDRSGEGQSRLHRISRWTGNQIGGVIGAPFGFSGSLAGSLAGELVGHAAGKSVDTLRGYKPKKVE